MNKVSQHIKRKSGLLRPLRSLAMTMAMMLVGGSLWAQTDNPFVIKVRNSGHYLAHVTQVSGTDTTIVLQDVTSFTPECLWYSGIEQNITGTNHNYYFIDHRGRYRFLTAPMRTNQPLGLSDDLPPTYLLSNTDTIYYFYDWDQEDWTNGDGGGVARGHQFTSITNQSDCQSCGHSWGDGECWNVYWVVYNNGWKTSSATYYDIDFLPEGQGGGRFHKVSVEGHPMVVNSVTNGGITGNAWTDWSPTAVGNTSYSVSVSSISYNYIPAYNTYSFREMKPDSTFISHTYHFSGNTQVTTPPPAAQTASQKAPKSFEWTITGDAAQFLSFESSGTPVHTVSGNTAGGSLSQQVYYLTLNQTGTKTATLKLVVTYADGSTQERSTTITLTTPCQNPPQAAAPIVNYDDVVVTWYDIAEKYYVQWKTGSENWSDSVVVISPNASTVSYRITGLADETTYNYRITAYCDSNWETPSENPTGSFTTGKEPELLIYGSVFGGGRVADVTGKTEVIIVNCDSIGAVYGGNDIAGTVQGNNGSNIILGVNEGDLNDTYGTTETTIKVGAVYGGGNGYYAYGGNEFHAATATQYNTVPVNAKVYTLSQTGQWNDSVWANTGSASVPLPTITKTAITMANDFVKVDTVFGGAKNAFLTATSGNGSSITIDGGTYCSVFGGNNVGGSQNAGKQYIKVDEAAKNSTTNYQTRIHTLFGSGNKVDGSSTDILVNGGIIDTLYAGGNEASVATAAKVEIACSLASGNGSTFGHTYSDAIASYNGTTLTIKDSYPWNGTGTYNVHTLFGGNNKSDMAVVPEIVLTSGCVGTVYGGGNAGDMVAEVAVPSYIDNDFGQLIFYNEPDNDNDNEIIPRKHSTYVELNSDNMVIDYLYGGCQMSNVYRSALVNMTAGYVGTVYGGCNISGDVGSNYLCDQASGYLPSGMQGPWSLGPRNERYQAVKGATFVKVSGGNIYNDVFAGSNGRYHCNNGKLYVSGINFDNLDTEENYVGMTVPTHNETHIFVTGDAWIKGNVYAGGNLACVGFIKETVILSNNCPRFVGMATVRMNGGEVQGSVFGGGNMASIWGSNAVAVEGGVIGGALYGGNDRIGLVAQITNRVLPPDYGYASDGNTSLADVRTYISLTGRPDVNTVYGGGNGDYDYSTGEYCNPNDKPVQSNTFVDVNIDGYRDGEIQGGHINTVYGGGNGVTVTGTTTVFLNVKGSNSTTEPEAYAHVGTIFGGNNKGDLAILPNVVLLKGQVDTIYGGCNQGAMVGSASYAGYDNVGSMVHLRNTYTANGVTVQPTGVVRYAAYGGCRMNGVTNNSLVLVEGGTHPANFFGGSDISGNIGGLSHVAVTGGTVGNVYGGGNGNYYYDGNKVYDIDHTHLIDTIVSGTITAPVCATSQVDILSGQVGTSGNGNARNVFGGGLGEHTNINGDVTINIGADTATMAEYTPLIYGDIYGGSALGTVNTNANNTSTVNFLNGALHGNLYGGGLGKLDPGVDTIAAKVNGKVYVNIGSETQNAANCFIDLREASVFGCNNVYGSPQDSVFVNVYKTGHTESDSASYVGTAPSTLTYAIDQVFGGGNQADYAPQNGNASSDRIATVNIFSCDNTVRRVFGGGNKAAAVGVATNIYGGRFNQVFGGGNGDGGAANIGNGGTNLMVSGGIINQLFGGSNLNGTIAGDMRVNVTNSGDCDEDITEFFGGSNEAPIAANLHTTIGCNTVTPVNIANIYGGSNLASITGNVQLDIYGGIFSNVYAGSKGVAASATSTGTAANITGNTILNLYGGTIDNAFGGSNANGNITGTIQVNVDDLGDCPLQVNTVYGGGNLAAYTPTYTPAPGTERISPEVNIKNATVNNAVYGGGLGNTAAVTASPQVTIGDNVAEHKAIVGALLNGSTTEYGDGFVFGGGDAAAVNGNTLVVYEDQNTASQVNRLFGGGNEAGVTGTATVNMNQGKVNAGIFGGCNTQGTVGGAIEVNVMGGTLGVEGTPMAKGIFGGGYGESTATTSNVVVNVGDATHAPTLYADVYGGSALGKVNTVETTTEKTQINFAKGTLHGNLYGGGLGQASPAISAIVNGNVEVNLGKDKTGTTIEGSTIYGSVFGANNVLGTPKGSVTVNLYKGALDSIFGGGNQANYVPTDATSAYPEVNIHDGTVNYKVVGGGNAAGITANPHVNISGGTLCSKITDAGVYGGCNTSGIVNGDIFVTITGDAANHTTIGDSSIVMQLKKPVNVHGGGYGQGTSTTGDVTVQFGSLDNNNEVHTRYPILYGDLYGGSALGNVNAGASNNTTVNVLNGTVKCLSEKVNLGVNHDTTYYYTGNIYGGGLGRKADLAHDITGVAARVNGEVHVNIGSKVVLPDTTIYHGQASIVDCQVFGCNNANGSPQQNVYVDVYQTKHTVRDSVQYNEEDRAYAIKNVFGGGNQAHFHPDENSGYLKKTYNSVYQCNNTIDYVYGGGNAADSDGSVVYVEGGRFNFIFGGGNGQVYPANIGDGGSNMTLLSGRVGWFFNGCNMQGTVSGEHPDVIQGCETNCPCGSDTLVVENFYFGANMATIYDGVNQEIDCEDNMDYRNVYAGSRLATIYGDVILRVRGGKIGNLYGGSEGSDYISADIRKYPTDSTTVTDPLLKAYLGRHPEKLGTGGNVHLILEGGKIGNVYGGENYHGLIEGTITVTVDSIGGLPEHCRLDIDYLYGGNNLAAYAPDSVLVGGSMQALVSPIIELQNGHVNYDVFGGSRGGNPEHHFGNGQVTSKPKVIVGDITNTNNRFRIGRNVYGGGSAAKVIGDTEVILQGNVDVGNNVYGGGKSADVDGSTNVIIVPTE